MKKFKTLASILAILLVAGMLAACGGGASSSAPAPAASSTAAPEASSTAPAGSEAEPAPAASDVKIGLIAMAFGTQSFNDDVLDGVKLAETELGVEHVAIEVPEVADAANSLRTLIGQGCNFLIVSSSDYRDGMEEVAAENPDIKFLYLAEALEGYENIMSTEYKENEGAFLAGALAAMLTQTDNVGVVNAVSEPLQVRFQVGFKAGAQAISPDVQVQTAFTNSYTDVNKGAELAGTMYSKGADYVSTFAGACNLGVFQAASDAGEGKYCFGAANGQFDQMPDKIVASVVKPVDQAILSIMTDYVNDGIFDASTPYKLGLKAGGVTLKWTTNTELLDEVVPQDVRDTIEDLREKVANGEITVPETEDDFASFDYSYEK